MQTQVINNYLYLMSMSDLAALQDISPNIDVARMNACIKDAQDLDLALFMGDAFWYDFNNQFALTGFLGANIINQATSQPDGTYTNQLITAGSGTGAAATFTVLSGKVTKITQTAPGIGYAVGDTFTWNGAAFSVATLCGVFNPGTSQPYQDFFNGVVFKDFSGNNVYYPGIIPALAYWAFARFIEVDRIRYTTTGPVAKRHDDSEPATPKEIALLVEMQRSKANAFCNKIEKFLYINKQQFPLWRMNETNKNSRQPGARIRAIDHTRYNRGAYGYGWGYDEWGNII